MGFLFCYASWLILFELVFPNILKMLTLWNIFFLLSLSNVAWQSTVEMGCLY